MKITPLILDQAPDAARSEQPDVAAFANAMNSAGSALSAADRAENAYAAHTGSLQDAVFERAQADVMLSVATATAQRTAQALQSILNMQV